MCNLWCWAFSPRKLFNLPPVFGLLWLVPGPPRGGHHASLEECDGAGPDLILIGLLRGAALFHTFGWSCTVSILLLLRYYSYSYTSLEPRLSSDGAPSASREYNLAQRSTVRRALESYSYGQIPIQRKTFDHSRGRVYSRSAAAASPPRQTLACYTGSS